MDLGTLTTLIAAVRRLAPGRRILLFGSSSLLASFSDVEPAAIGVAITLDADFFLDPDDALFREMLSNALGQDRPFHITHGHYGDFVDLRMAEAFPNGWRDRLVPMPGFQDVFALQPLDMAVTKIMATARSRWALRMARGGVDRGMKDINTIVALLKGGRLDRAALEQRLSDLDREPALIVESTKVLAEIDCLVAVETIAKKG
jgi:hypothetical protein